jgi:hypothetical protein
MKKMTTEADLAHKMRAQLVRLYEASCAIEYPKGSDAAFRDALQSRLNAGVKELAKDTQANEEGLIAASQDVRLYEASAKIRNPDASALEFRVKTQKCLGTFFRLQDACREGAGK